MSDPGPGDAPVGAAAVPAAAAVKRPPCARTRRMSRVGPRGVGVAADPDLGALGVGDHHCHQHRPVRLHHGAAGAEPDHHRAPGDKGDRRALSTKVVQNKITDALPPKAKPLVAPLTNQVKGYVHSVALRVFENPKFGQLFDALNRRTHNTVVDVLTGKQTPLTKTLGKSGQVVLNLTPQLNQLIDTLNTRGVTLFNPVKPILTNSSGLGLTVVSKAQVSKFAGLFNTLVTLGWAVPVTAVVLGVLGILIAVERRKTLLRLAVGVGLFTLVLLAFLAFGRTTFLKQAGSHNFNVPAAGAVWDTLLRFLKQDLRWTLLATFLVALGAWVAGPAGYAVWIRTKAVAGGRWVVRQVRAITSGAAQGLAASSATQRTGGWIAEHIKGLRVLGVAIAGLIVLLGGDLSGWDLLILVIVVAVYLVLLQLVAHWARLVAGSPTRRPAPG